MNTEIKENTNHQRINKACENFKNISDDVKNQKFEHIDTWLYKTSKILKIENKICQNLKFVRFDFGTIIKVDFGINIGSEVSGPHFAIVLEKYDSTKSNSITVLPLTSQNKKNNLFLGDLIIDEFTKRLKSYLDKLISETNTETEDNNSIVTIELSHEKSDEINTLKNMISYYSNYAKNSYASINQITTISKNKIIAPKNKFDIIGRAKCSSKTMKIISKEMIKRYTNLKITE